MNYYNKLFKHIYITRNIQNKPEVQRVLDLISTIPLYTVEKKEQIPLPHQKPSTLFITSLKGKPVTKCPGSKGHICCNYLTLDLYMGCMIGCSYCIMQSYLDFSPIIININLVEQITTIRSIALRNKNRMVRIGTGEVGDSLHLDPLFQLSQYFIKGLYDLKNVYFELKTKTNFIHHLFSIEQKGNTVIGFSLNPQVIIDNQEGMAASLLDRINAAHLACENGYLVSFHFDPIIMIKNWQTEYENIFQLLNQFPPKKVAWISLGTLRYTRQLKEKMGFHSYMAAEFVLSKDKKYRYIQKTRLAVYKYFIQKLSTIYSFPIYLCMESAPIWRYIYKEKILKKNALYDIFKPVKL